jgi:outer membrane murein-binding lipoprotein Lpp
MKFTTVALTVSLLLVAGAPRAQNADLEARINELEAALDHLQRRIEKLERVQTPPRMSAAEAKAVLHKKQAEDECTEQLGPAPDFVPMLGTKVNPEFMAYRRKHRACVRDKEVP